MRNQVLLCRSNQAAFGRFRSAASLHGHTSYSKESLGFIRKYLDAHPPLRAWIASQSQRSERESGIRLDFERAYWTPPLCPLDALRVEAAQIESFGLLPLVSLSDHNDIEAAACLRLLPAAGLPLARLPISVEWTFPFGQAVFHIGVHSLPAASAQALMALLRHCTARADDRKRLAMLSELSQIPSVLLVFNHPLWNFNGLSPQTFRVELRRFLECAGKNLHALELNGMRNHRENRAVLDLAAEWDQVVISGGDRHACEPNAVLNLTNAADFSEFVEEIRVGRQSTVLIAPQYAEPLPWRLYQSFTHVIREYTERPAGQRRWDERTYHPNADGAVVPIADLWPQGPPAYLRRIFTFGILAAHLPLRRMMRAMMSGAVETLLLAHPQSVPPPRLSGSGAEADESLA